MVVETEIVRRMVSTILVPSSLVASEGSPQEIWVRDNGEYRIYVLVEDWICALKGFLSGSISGFLPGGECCHFVFHLRISVSS